MKHFFYSDPHFWHRNILKYARRRDFLSTEEKDIFDRSEDFHVSDDSVNRMNDNLLAEINDLVGEDDIMWILGDWCFASKQHPERLEILKQKIKCRNCYLILGNHDSYDTIYPYFNSCYEKVTIVIADDGRYWIRNVPIVSAAHKIVLTHCAMSVWEGAHKGWWNLYGHSHSTAENFLENHFPGRKSMDVGVDNAFKLTGKYRPFSFEEIKEIMSKRAGISIDHHCEMEEK